MTVQHRRARCLTSLGWAWSSLGSSRTQHLIPARIGPASRTACNRMNVTTQGPHRYLFEDAPDGPRCSSCVEANGGAID